MGAANADDDVGGLFGRIRRRAEPRLDLPALFGDARCTAPRLTYRELFRRVETAAAGFLDLGVRAGDRVGVVAENFDLWMVCDLALLSLGAVTVPRGGDAGDDEIVFCLGHAECRFAVFETGALHDRARPRLPGLEACVILRGAADGAVSWEVLSERGAARLARGGDAELRERLEAVRSDDLATIVYTSGTTGNPKGVMLAHGNILHNLRALPQLFDFRPGMKFVSFLPTWHTFERTVEYVVLDNGLELHYSSKRTLKADLTRVAPDFLVGVPRVWETFFQGVLQALEKAPPRRKAFAERLLAASRTYHRLLRRARGRALERDGRVARPSWTAQIGLRLGAFTAFPGEWLARRTVYAKLKAALGGRLAICISGGGPLPPEVEDFFLRAGLPFYNGYGLTETAPVACVRTPDRNIAGTIGRPLPETEIRIVGDDGRDLGRLKKGVIQIRGPQVMRGYWRNERATAACLTPDGWFDTGDVGLLTDEGDVVITGRAKDTIVLRGGENVEPENIETALSASPVILDVVVVGHAQKALGALIVPDWDVVRARRPGLPQAAPEALADRPEVAELLRAEVSALICRERGFRVFECVTKVCCLPRPFSPEEGTLTHTLKKRRNVIEERFADRIRALFDD
ncbi:MAG TPA: long-chain fatty acid--CoA ligase [Planctomycetota bacterium]|nr:long-chain fatty acid--CoA ligase [Planctomycetota bacterium]